MTEDTAPDSQPQKPMAGVRVLDIATYIAAPHCATLLAEFGAEVIKVEQPGVGDPCRRLGTVSECGDTLVWMSEARNKSSITLNLKDPKGQEILKRLVAESDVLCENFRPGTLEQWGLGWEVFKAINPKLVMLRVSGYGQTGPYKDKPGFGRIGNAYGGISFLSGDPDRPPATPGSATLADYMSGLYGALGVMMALRSADATGVGQVVDIGLYEPIFRILDELAPAYDKKGYVRQRMGAPTVNVCPHSHYPTKDDRWVAIACTNDKIYARLANLMGHGDVAGDGRYGTITQREADRPGVDGMVTEWTRAHSQKDVVTLCEGAEVPCGIVAAIDELFEEAQYAARENIVRVMDPRIGDLAVPNVVPRLTETPGSVDTLGPALGANNDDVYGGMLGLSGDELTELRDAGVI
ncbi:MAG: CaiB/BaiF CoA transferase family protein [Alphaproteobacteria bacterium]|jgi:crotonobetainyl-CoA:carnitine CoA-transferase CaiB-like acyl-CoA transferase